MKLKFTCLTALLCLLSMPVTQAADSTVVAKVGESEIKAEDLKSLLESLPLRDQMQLSRDPAALNEFVRSLIVQQIVLKEALSKKWEQQPRITAQLDRLRQQAIAQTYLQSLSIPPENYPSATEIQAAYEMLKKNNALQIPRQYHLAQIYIACPKGADKAVEEKAQARVDALGKALKGGDFSSIAKSQSDDAASSQRGGDLGWVPDNQIQPEIRNVVTSLSKGSTSDMVRMNDGWHVIRLIDVKEPSTASLDEVKAGLVRELRNQRAQDISKAYLAKVLQQNPVTLNEIAISKLLEAKGN